MRQGNGGDRERSGDPHISQRDERVKSSLLQELVVHLAWKKLGEECGGERSKSRRGEAGGKDLITLRTSKENKKTQRMKAGAGWFSLERCSICLMSPINRPCAYTPPPMQTHTVMHTHACTKLRNRTILHFLKKIWSNASVAQLSLNSVGVCEF